MALVDYDRVLAAQEWGYEAFLLQVQYNIHYTHYTHTLYSHTIHCRCALPTARRRTTSSVPTIHAPIRMPVVQVWEQQGQGQLQQG
jgi:hypothetical protein